MTVHMRPRVRSPAILQAPPADCAARQEIGITLPQYECGNACIPELLRDERFLCREYDVVDLCKKVSNRTDFLRHCMEMDYSTLVITSFARAARAQRTQFGGFDLVIVCITCH